MVFQKSPFSLAPVWIASDSTAMEGETQWEEGELGNGKGAVVKTVALETIWLDSFSVPASESHLGDVCGTVPFCI